VAYCGGNAERAQAIEDRIAALLGQLSLSQKVSLLHGAGPVPIDGVWQVNGVPELGIPGLHMLDGPRGVSAMARVNATNFPVAILRGATWDPELERRVGAAVAREANATGADVVLAPTINILRHPRWGRTQETYGEDVHHLGEFGVAFVQGVQSEPVLASVKHFAANSIEDTRTEVDVSVDERTLREIYLPHFRRAVQEAQVGSVMSAYNSVNGRFCDLNEHLLTTILKEEWGFQGFVESDWFFGTHGDTESVRAGLDVEMPSGLHFAQLAARVRDGILEEDEIDQSVRRVLRAQFCFGLDVTPPTRDPSARETAEHLELALEVARRGIVLLYNDGALPLNPEAATDLVVLGRLADVANTGDVGSSQVVSTDVVTALEGIRARAGDAAVQYIAGNSLSSSQTGTVSAADAAIVVVGLDATHEGEGLIGAGDRDSLALSPEQVALIRAVGALNPRTIVVLEGSGAIEVAPWIDAVAALVMAWYPGQQGGNAIADVLFGRVNPSGRLPMTFPVAEADLPPFDNVALDVRYDYLHGYRYLERQGTAAQFPFGFGLSYTTFALANARVANPTIPPDGVIEVAVDVTNTGDTSGIETVQVYIAVLDSRVERAPQDLRGFAQVALEPGQTETVTLAIPAQDLAFYDVAASAWQIEATDYAVRIGTNARDQLPALVVTVQ
jgi:beta-glucosidase